MTIGNNEGNETPLNKSMTRSVSKPDWKVACFLAPRQALVFKQKAYLLGDMPKRHVGYALTLGDISGLMNARSRLILLKLN